MQLPILEWRFVVAVTLLMASFSVSADTRVAQVWTCMLNEGKTVEDLNTLHGKWLAWTNKQTYGGDIQGSIAVPMVSDRLAVVLIIDSYPDRATYAADSDAVFDTPEGQALIAEHVAMAACTSNVVYSVTTSGSG